MAEKHAAVSVSTANWGYFMRQLWNFVENTQSGIVQFVQEGGNYAVKTGGAFWNGTDDLSFTGFTSDNDYIVIEPVNSYPGGDKWQVKVVAIDVSDVQEFDSSVEVSWLGGYSTSTETFGSNQTTGAIASWIADTDLNTNDTWYFSCSNTDSYANSSGIQTYTYLRVLIYDQSQADNNHFRGFYCGGYIPTEPDNDTKPVVFFAKQIKQQSTSNSWGNVSDTNSGLLPGNYAHDVAGGNVSAYVNSLNNDEFAGYRLSRSGNWVNPPTLICDYNNEQDLGVFGRFTMLGGNYDRTDGATDNNAEYKIANNTTIRWKPSA